MNRRNCTHLEIITTKLWSSQCLSPSVTVLIKQHYVLLWLYKMVMNKWLWSVSMCMECQWQGKAEILGKKCFLVSVWPPQIPHRLVPWEWNWALSVRMSYAASYLVWILNFSYILYKFVMNVLSYSIKLLLHCNTLTCCTLFPDVVTCHSQMQAHCV